MRDILLLGSDDRSATQLVKVSADRFTVRRAVSPDDTETSPALIVIATGGSFAATRPVLVAAKKRHHGVPVLLIGDCSDTDKGKAIGAGAADILRPPVSDADLRRHIVSLADGIEREHAMDDLIRQKNCLKCPLIRETHGYGRFIGSSPAIKKVFAQIEKVRKSSLNVFIHGESGAGKELVARTLHESSAHHEGPFMAINCGAIPENLLESELFGYEKGAFTGADRPYNGKIIDADGGTLFLDEVAEMPTRVQAKLLKFLDSMRFRRLGGQREIAVSLRIIAATNQDAEAMVRAGRLREDLYHRLAVFVIEIPELVERREDIPGLARGFATFFSERVKKRPLTIAPAALERLMAYRFPGNVRELRNVIERAVILAQGSEIGPDDIILPTGRSGSAAAAAAAPLFSIGLDGRGAPPSLEAVERAYVARVLEYCDGHRTTAASTLGISYPTFLKRLRELGLDN